MRGKTGNAQRSEWADETEQEALTPLLCEKTFAGFCKSQSSKEVHEAVLLRLVESDMRLLRIASARARRDCAAVAQEANALAGAADALGLFQAAHLARHLERACLSGDLGSTYDLISRLSEAFQNSGCAVEALLQRGTAAQARC